MINPSPVIVPHIKEGTRSSINFLNVFNQLPFISLPSAASSYAAACTPRAARPDGSGFLDQAASHSTAFAVLQATLGPPGTVDLAAFYSKMQNQQVLKILKERKKIQIQG